MTPPAKPERKGHVGALLIILGFNAAIGGFLFGYDTASMSAALLQVKRSRIAGDRCPGLADHPLAIWEQALVTSFVVLGAFLSSSTAGFFNGILGRRKVLLCGALFFLAGEVCMTMATSLAAMLVARLVVGLGVGISSHTVPLFISECAPSHLRGTLCFLNDLMCVVGQVCASIVASILFYTEVSGGWRYMLGCAAVPSSLMFVGFAMSLESPRWLMSKGRCEEARGVLMALRAGADAEAVEQEYRDMLQGVQSEAGGNGAGPGGANQSWLRRLFAERRIRRALLLGCGLSFLQQWSGINTIMYFGASVLKQAGGGTESLAAKDSLVSLAHPMHVMKLKRASETVQMYCFSDESKRDVAFTVVLASAQMLGVVVSFLLVDRLGRRPLILGSLTGVVLSLTAIGFVFTAHTVNLPLIIIFVALYLLSFGLGMSPVPWTVNAEIYPQSVRGTCISISTATNWISNFIVSSTFLSFSILMSTNHVDPHNHPNGVFWFYGAIALVGLILLSVYMPETKGLTLEQIGRLFEAPDERALLK